MLGTYRRVLSAPGARGFTLAGLVLRLPLAMYPVGLVLLISLTLGDYARGGVLTAAYIVGGALGSPLLSRIADRGGQRSVLLPAAGTHLLAIAALLALVRADAPLGAQMAAAALLGASFVPVGPLVRARWVGALAPSRPDVSTALSLESTLDEVTFVLGPLLAAALATTIDPKAPFFATGALVLVGAGTLHAMRDSAPAVYPGPRSRREALPRVTFGIVLVTAAVGVTLVSIDLAAIAFVGEAGQESWTGAVLACFALGSGVAGFTYGATSWRRPVEERLPLLGVVFALLPLLFLAVVDVRVLAVAMFVVGIGTAPLLATLFGTLERVSPTERLTEGLAWVATGLSIGAGLAAPAVGMVADAAGGRTALTMPVVAALVAGILAVTVARWARRTTEASAPIAEPA